MSNYIIPVFIIALFVYSSFKKVNNYSTFVGGAKKSLHLVFDIFAYIVGIFIVVELLNTSGIMDKLTMVLSPVFNFLGIPTQLTQLVLVKPFSGSGGLALLYEIFEQYGVDSYISKCACVILGSSETVFYVSSVYFSQTSVKKLGIAIPIALVCCFISVIISCFACRFI